MARFSKGTALLLVATAATLTGCTIQFTQPVKEVAYDFSDRDFYDRAYAPSPRYAESTPARVTASLAARPRTVVAEPVPVR
ncbi:MAG: hypothetical protein FJ096_10020 [Deltaproteobacteria bacterium]|nr:hypothetical protein [Deltaproteobacteria bacterium]